MHDVVRLGIVGSRTFTDEGLMQVSLRDLVMGSAWVVSMVVSGGATGADSLAREWAKKRGFVLGRDLIEHLPDKERYGWPRAAFERNTLIVRDSEVLLAFFGPGEPPSVNKSGTMDTVRKAIAKRIPVHLYFQR
jgi:hypothetical protein